MLPLGFKIHYGFPFSIFSEHIEAVGFASDIENDTENIEDIEYRMQHWRCPWR
jgi:hypothetical protein